MQGRLDVRHLPIWLLDGRLPYASQGLTVRAEVHACGPTFECPASTGHGVRLSRPTSRPEAAVGQCSAVVVGFEVLGTHKPLPRARKVCRHRRLPAGGGVAGLAPGGSATQRVRPDGAGTEKRHQPQHGCGRRPDEQGRQAVQVDDAGRQHGLLRRWRCPGAECPPRHRGPGRAGARAEERCAGRAPLHRWAARTRGRAREGHGHGVPSQQPRPIPAACRQPRCEV
mmetsp:Transcript_38956/g.125099  ORF Transcript_38956/g.125099 Transcript_38956/m.125099 type:complete len:226 (-) Transcript_38956:503-1180(-)